MKIQLYILCMHISISNLDFVFDLPYEISYDICCVYTDDGQTTVSFVVPWMSVGVF